MPLESSQCLYAGRRMAKVDLIGQGESRNKITILTRGALCIHRLQYPLKAANLIYSRLQLALPLKVSRQDFFMSVNLNTG